MDILEKLGDLHKQATTERSHFYVASTVIEAIHEISTLRLKLNTSDNSDYQTLKRPIVLNSELANKIKNYRSNT